MNKNSQNQGTLFGFDTGSLDPIDILTPPATMGSIAMADGVSVLLLGQSDPTENGPWEYNASLGRLTRMTRRSNCRVGAFVPAGSIAAIGSGDLGGSTFALFGSGEDGRGQPGGHIGTDTFAYQSLTPGVTQADDDFQMIQQILDSNDQLFVQRVRDNGTSSTVAYFDSFADLHAENPTAAAVLEPVRPFEADQLIRASRQRSYFDGQTWDATALDSLELELSECAKLEFIQNNDCSFPVGFPDAMWSHPSLRWFYNYRCNFSASLPVPPAGIASNIEFMVFDQCPAGSRPLALPAEWSNLALLRYVYLRRNGYTSAEVNSLAQQFSDLLDAGMGSFHNNNHRLYLNQTGGSQNAALTVIPAGWQAASGYIRRIGATNQRIYHNS